MQYQYVKVPVRTLMNDMDAIQISRLNEYGKEGWELVMFSYVNTKATFAYFKKELKEKDTSHFAWCPDCGDALDCVPIKNKDGMITDHEYQCFGCMASDKGIFKLVHKKYTKEKIK